jgi:hypothetical protein
MGRRGNGILRKLQGLASQLNENGVKMSYLGGNQFVIPTFDPLNSTTTPLGANGVFTGSAVDVSQFVSIDVSVLSDQGSAINGLIFQFSTDGTTWNFPVSFTVLANVGNFYSVAPRAKFFRAIYTNGAIAQGSLTLAIFDYGVTRSTYQTNLDAMITQGPGVEVIRAVVSAEVQGTNPTQYINLQTNASGNLITSSTSIGSVGGGSPASGSTLIGAQYNTTPPALTNTQQAALQVTSRGALIVSQGGSNATYNAYSNSLSTGTLATDVFSITGSATKLVTVLSINISATRTTASHLELNLVKRSAVLLQPRL